MRTSGRTPNTERRTPFLDVCLADLFTHLEPRGRAAQLARFLGGDDPGKAHAIQTKLRKWKLRLTIPNGEDVLAVNAWRHPPPPPGRETARPFLP